MFVVRDLFVCCLRVVSRCLLVAASLLFVRRCAVSGVCCVMFVEPRSLFDVCGLFVLIVACRVFCNGRCWLLAVGFLFVVGWCLA